jgi:hypothetical protein
VRGEAGELKSQVQVIRLVGAGGFSWVDGKGTERDVRSISGWVLLKGILRQGCIISFNDREVMYKRFKTGEK